ncbi:hypothetical protein J1N35_026542 [Gossypium stocksii]|uniref:Uncharacterized protein n=1 Tax=Gossypium stocksii TaxID=47602 RepID=A0A9D3V8L3_9ROSI|nr:hypothetical protein J1N35_026542 [Gossypium stocksii]
MENFLIRLDDEHISVDQLQMEETQEAHISSSMRRVYYHTQGHVVTTWVTSGLANSDWVNCRNRLRRCIQKTFREVSKYDL